MKVRELKTLHFGSLPLNEKLNIKLNGRPTPNLNIVQGQPEYNNRKGFTRKFDSNVYNKTSWICGCEETNLFFFFVLCVFFSILVMMCGQRVELLI